MRQLLVTSPDYLSRRGHPRTPQDLGAHDVLIRSRRADRHHLELFRLLAYINAAAYNLVRLIRMKAA
jgi:hypothetical protein